MWNKIWYTPHLTFFSLLLLPFSLLFFIIISIRKFLYRHQFLSSYKLTIPVIIVGNITVGGTGKTPFVIWLCKWLISRGYKPGIATGGYDSKIKREPHLVNENNTANEIGDEAFLFTRHLECPIVIAKDRVAAAKKLESLHCNIIICDDGLQHYRLQRDLEIVMIDGQRRFGNGYLLPAGPLREPISRLENASMQIVNGGNEHECVMQLIPHECISLHDKTKCYLVKDFPHKKIHAVAGIGNPERFFTDLVKLGFEIIRHVFADHHVYEKSELYFEDNFPVVMTEKDAVKCFDFDLQNTWYVSIETNVNERVMKLLEDKILAIR